MASGYFQGGDFVELLSAQGKAPAAAWKLQGKISKTFDKGIKGNAFQLDGSSETKMQLPKAASSSLGLAQRFVVLQLLVPFTRSFSVEICFSDFQKVRRRFVVASAFRETARTALHVQLPLSAAEVPRDQWMNLVFDLQTLSESHFPDSGFRSMESICVGGSCRLKRIFTTKYAPTPSRGSQAVSRADIRDIPRQFVFSATQRGATGALPLPTLYFAMEALSSVGVQGAAITSKSAPKADRRSQTAPVSTQAKPVPKGTRAARPVSGSNQRKKLVGTSSVTTAVESDVSDPPRQRLRTPVRVSTVGSKLRQPQSKLGKLVSSKQERSLPQSESSPCGAMDCAVDEQHVREMPEEASPTRVLPVQVEKSLDTMKEDVASPLVPALAEDESPHRPPSRSRSNLPSSSASNISQEEPSRSLRQSILGEIQQKLASLEDEDEKSDQRDRELFLRHTSLHSGEWHLQQLQDDDLSDNDLNEDGKILSDDEDVRIQLSSSWRRELEDLHDKLSPEAKQRQSCKSAPVKAIETPRYDVAKDSIFSFSSLAEPETTARKSASRLFDFDSLLQDAKPKAPSMDKEKSDASTETDSSARVQLESRIESALFDAEDAADDLELTRLLSARRSARQLLRPQTCREDEAGLSNEQRASVSKPELVSGSDPNRNSTLFGDVDVAVSQSSAREQDDWVVVEKDSDDDSLSCQTVQDGGLDVDVADAEHGLSIDLTSELSASGEGSVHNLDGIGEYESTIGPTSPGTDDSKAKSEGDRANSSQQDDDDDDSSFDFEDLVEDAESSEEEKETQVPCTSALSITKTSTQRSPDVEALRQSKDRDQATSGSPSRNQHTHEQRGAAPELPSRLTSVKSPLIHSSRQIEDRDQFLAQTSLSSSFSSRRLQKLLESTDWTAELNAQVDTMSSGSLHAPPSARSSDRKQQPAYHRSPASSTDAKRSTARRIRRSPSKPQTPSASSVELVYDPLLRCYYDPVSNKYYALAE